MALIKVVEREKEGSKHPTRYYSSIQEKQVAKDLGGNQTKNSGAVMFDKGDVKLANWLVECKTRTFNSESMSIKKEWLEKNNQEALFMGKENSCLIFNFGPNTKNYVIIDEDTFKDLIGGNLK